jgi:hypothetical protein
VAIVAKAAYEVHRNQLLCLSGLKLLLALASFIAAPEAPRHPKSQHLRHTVVWIWSYLRRGVGFVAGYGQINEDRARAEGADFMCTLK